MMYTEDELLPLSGIQHFAFCRRQWALIHIERQWDENVLTVQGKLFHEKADNPFIQESRGNLIIARSVPISSYQLGLYGVADVVEFIRIGRQEASGVKGVVLPDFDGMWLPHPVEYKKGKPKPDERDMVQLCAQAMCLEEMYSMPIDSGDLYYGEIRNRVKVEFTGDLRRLVCNLSEQMHVLFKEGDTPKAVFKKQCKLCSLSELCIPKLGKTGHAVKKYVNKALADAE